MVRTNEEIREQIEGARLRYYEVADVLCIAPETLSRWLRKELSEDRKIKVIKAIEQASERLRI